MDTFGEFLRNQREKKGIRLEEIASITKIHLHNLQFLEDGDWERLPPEPFIRGFIIAYAKYVGLDTADTLERYALEMGKSEAPLPEELQVISTNLQPAKPLTAAAPKNFRRDPISPAELLQQSHTLPLKKFALGIGFTVGIVLIASVVIIGKRNATEETKIDPGHADQVTLLNPVPPLQNDSIPAQQGPTHPQETIGNKIQNAIGTHPRETASQEVPVPQGAAKKGSPEKTIESKAETKSSSSEFAHEIVVDATERSWMKVVIDDKPPKETYSKPGEKAVFQAKEKIKLVLGNSSSATVLHNGEKTTGKKFQGTIHFYVFPKGARFPQDPPKRALTTTPAGEGSTASDGDIVPPLPIDNQETKSH